MKLTEAGRRDHASGLVSPRGHSQPKPIFSLQFWIFLLFFILIFYFQRKVVSSDVWCEKGVARGGVGPGSVRGKVLASSALPRLLPLARVLAPSAPHTAGAQYVFAECVSLLCSRQSPAMAELPAVRGEAGDQAGLRTLNFSASPPRDDR